MATVLAVFFAVRCNMLAKEADADAPADPADLTVEEYVGMMKSAGYTSADILYALEQSDPDGFAGYVGSALPAALPSEIIRPEGTNSTEGAVTGAGTEPVSEDPAGMSSGNGEKPPALQTDKNTAAGEDVSAMFPELYAEKSAFTKMPDSKTVFLTFDDGPSAGTYDLLYILKKHGIKATFFMSAGKTEQSREQMAAVAEAGHTIGVHTFAHDPDSVYTSVESFLTDFYQTYKMIYDATGVKPEIYRLAQGGDPEVLEAIRAEMGRRGFTEFPPNCDSGDRDGEKSWQYIYDTATENVAAMDSAPVLHLHDSADDYITVLTAEDIIEYLEDEGYSFAPLDSSVKIE